MSRFLNCEWCDNPSGGAVLCRACIRREVWTLLERPNDETQRFPLDDATSAAHTESSVLREGAKAARVSVRAAFAALGGKWGRSNRGLSPLDCVQIVREEHPTVGRLVMWPNQLPAPTTTRR